MWFFYHNPQNKISTKKIPRKISPVKICSSGEILLTNISSKHHMKNVIVDIYLNISFVQEQNNEKKCLLIANPLLEQSGTQERNVTVTLIAGLPCLPWQKLVPSKKKQSFAITSFSSTRYKKPLIRRNKLLQKFCWYTVF